MQLQNVNTSRYLEIENDILKRGVIYAGIIRVDGIH